MAVTADAVAKAVFIHVAHVQAQADVLARVGAEVGIQAAQIFAAALGFDGRAAAGLRRFAHAVDDPALTAAAVQHGRRAFEHFDAFDIVQVALVLAVVANAVQIEVVAGVEAADTQTVEAGVGAAADVGHATQGIADVVGAVIGDVRRFDRIDGLGHITHRGRGTGRGVADLDARIIGLRFSADGGGG